jgi:nitrile hydratase accessory protein
MLGAPDSPPRMQGKLLFDEAWQRSVFGMALSLSKAGYFEWEDFRVNLIESIAQWERAAASGCAGQPNWDYYERFRIALMRTLEAAGVLDAGELATLEAGLSSTERSARSSET